MSLIFPDNPTLGQTTFTGDSYWAWDGERWYVIPNISGYTGSLGFTGSTGNPGPAGGYTGSAGAGRPVAFQTLTSTGVAGPYAMNYTITHPLQVMVMVNGLVQIPFTDYTVSGGVPFSTITFITVPPVNSDIELLYFNTDPVVGFQGSSGFQGSKGFTGSIGAGGTDGYSGSRGFTGSIGYTGSRGDSGYGGSTGAVGAPDYSQKIISTGSSNYSLDRQVTSPNHIIVSVNGLVQIPTTDYAILGLSTISFVNPPIVSSDIEIRYFSLATQVGYQGSAGISGSAGAGYRGSIGFQGSSGQGGYSAIYIGPTSDPSPFDGELWFDTDNGILSIYYEVANTWVGIGPGLRGADGYTGSIGPSGGYSGSQGGTGFAGSLGFTGSEGAGFTGSIGYTGSLGIIGYTGSQGDPSGYTGSAGLTGYTGSPGSPGGFSGSIGYTGSEGVGYTGSQGLMGYTGSAGGGSGTGLSPRNYDELQTSSLASGASGSLTFSGSAKTYALLSMYVSSPAWVRIYDSSTSLSADTSRPLGQEPSYNSGVIAEVVTSTNGETIKFTPGVIGMNNDSPVSDDIRVYVTNVGASTATITVGISYVSLEG